MGTEGPTQEPTLGGYVPAGIVCGEAHGYFTLKIRVRQGKLQPLMFEQDRNTDCPLGEREG